MGDCTYCGKRRINFNQDEDYTMRIENNDRGDYVIVTGELMIDSIPISFCPFCGRDLHKEGGPMTTHRLKVFVKYADAIMNGTKTFEIRKNDRGYEVGDKIVFDVVTNEGYDQERAGIGLGYDAVRRSVLPVRRRWPEGLLVRWRRPEPCEGDGCGLLEREGKR